MTAPCPLFRNSLPWSPVIQPTRSSIQSTACSPLFLEISNTDQLNAHRSRAPSIQISIFVSSAQQSSAALAGFRAVCSITCAKETLGYRHCKPTSQTLRTTPGQASISYHTGILSTISTSSRRSMQVALGKRLQPCPKVFQKGLPNQWLEGY